MKNLSAGLKAHYASGTTTLATCWRATLTDGTVVAATSLDRDIVFDGLTYVAAHGYSPSDIESSAELNPDNLEVEGFLASPAITDDDIHSGRWDYAAIEIFEVNYADLTMGKNILRTGTLGEVRGGRSKFTAELRGLLQAYTRTIVRLVTEECGADLGDARCKVNLAAITVNGMVSSVLENRIIVDQGAFQVDDWYTGGKLTWTSGANAGRSMEVKRNTFGRIELTHAMYSPILPGDNFTIYPGCLKRFKEDCIGKFANGLNFRGFPDLPGQKIYRQGGVHYSDSVSSGGGSGTGTGGSTGGTGGGTGGTSSSPYLDHPQEGYVTATGIGFVNGLTDAQFEWGDVYYKTASGEYTLDSSLGTLSHITERRIYSLKLSAGYTSMPYSVGDYIVVHAQPLTKTWTADGVQMQVALDENGWTADMNASAYIYFHRIARVVPSSFTFELWNIRPLSSPEELARLLTMPVEWDAPPTNNIADVWRDTYNNYTSHIDPRPRSYNNALAPTIASPWPGSPKIYGISPDLMNPEVYAVRYFDVLLGDVWYKTPSGGWTTDSTQGTVSHITLRKQFRSWATLLRPGDMVAIGPIPDSQDLTLSPYKEWVAPDGSTKTFIFNENNLWLINAGTDNSSYQIQFEHIVRVVEDDYFEIWSALHISSDVELQAYLAMPEGWTYNPTGMASGNVEFGIGAWDFAYDNPYPLSHNGVVVPAGPSHLTHIYGT